MNIFSFSSSPSSQPFFRPKKAFIRAFINQTASSAIGRGSKLGVCDRASYLCKKRIKGKRHSFRLKNERKVFTGEENGLSMRK